ncbi:hypothetical protein NW733_02705 [Mycoplasmopsis felis]|uniref:hypothetical protein n=2 Tax=Mycoplasmopsis felis TaxID=33923 RepID=UPI0021DF62C0|nr:hypothetical protein [Mycoplasmopsis felis]MCU9931604.1 hypothetical protein [Mycoplasmopsis felis]
MWDEKIMLQPKRLKNRWTKLTRWFNVRDAIEIIVICALTYTLSWVIFKDFEIVWNNMFAELF